MSDSALHPECNKRDERVSELAELVRRSQALAADGDWGDEAIQVNARLVDLQPRADGALLRLAWCHYQRGEWEKAAQLYRRVTETGRSGKRKLAAKRLEECLEAHESERCDSYGDAFARGLALRDRGKPAAARYWLRRAYALARRPPEKTSVLAAWAAALRSARKFDDALQILQRSIHIDPSRKTNGPSYTTLIATLVDLGQLSGALLEAEQMLKVQPGEEHLLNACGRLFTELAKRDGDAVMARRAAACFAAVRERSRREVVR